MERIIVDSGLITVPVGVRDKQDPTKIHEFELTTDISDTVLQVAQEHNKEIQKELEDIQKKYVEIIGDELDENNFKVALDGITEMIRLRFDDDFGVGKYDEISSVGGGNSFVNMLELYQRASEYVGDRLAEKFANITKKSANKKAKYFKKHKK